MLFKRISRSEPEKIFVVAKNSYSTASLTNGQAVAWDAVTDQDGVGVTLAAAGSGISTAGIASETIAAGEYGLIQCYGYHSAARVRTVTGGSPTGAGTALALVNTVFCLETVSTASTATLKFPSAILMATQASFTTKAVAVFIKAM